MFCGIEMSITVTGSQIADVNGGVTGRPGYAFTFDEMSAAKNYQDYGIPLSNNDLMKIMTDIKIFFMNLEDLLFGE